MVCSAYSVGILLLSCSTLLILRNSSSIQESAILTTVLLDASSNCYTPVNAERVCSRHTEAFHLTVDSLANRQCEHALSCSTYLWRRSIPYCLTAPQYYPPASQRCISMKTSSTLLSRQWYRSMNAVSKAVHLCSSALKVKFRKVVVRLQVLWPPRYLGSTIILVIYRVLCFSLSTLQAHPFYYD